jgi:hypothetical protein
MPLKIFGLGVNGFVPSDIAELVKRPEQSLFHARQQRVLIPATSRKAAAELANACRIGPVSVGDKEMRIAGGLDLDALNGAQVIRPGHIYVIGEHRKTGAPVAMLTPGEAPRIIGHIHRDPGSHNPEWAFTPVTA